MYLLTFDNHNSVNGIRQFARANGASVSYVPLTPADLRVSEEALARHLEAAAPVRRRRFARRRSGPAAGSLFAFPAQSNFSGVQHPLAWIAQAQDAGYDVLLDAAAFAPASRLDLSRWHPDYVSLSFYKIFGYPTGIGALLVRKPALAKLRRPWYAGGTITFSSVRAEAAPGEGFYLTPGPAGFEDGTVDYLGIPAVGIGLDHISSVGIETIHTRVMCLTGWLLDALGALRHSNGAPVVRIYGPAGTDRRGATIAMNFFDPAGVLIDSVRAERRANRAGISLRSGCHCNPGVREAALGFSTEGDGGRLQGQGPAGLPGVPPRDRREDHRGGAGLTRPGHHLRRRLPVLGVRRRLPRPAFRRGRGLSCPDTGAHPHPRSQLEYGPASSREGPVAIANTCHRDPSDHIRAICVARANRTVLTSGANTRQEALLRPQHPARSPAVVMVQARGHGSGSHHAACSR